MSSDFLTCAALTCSPPIPPSPHAFFSPSPHPLQLLASLSFHSPLTVSVPHAASSSPVGSHPPFHPLPLHSMSHHGVLIRSTYLCLLPCTATPFSPVPASPSTYRLSQHSHIPPIPPSPIPHSLFHPSPTRSPCPIHSPIPPSSSPSYPPFPPPFLHLASPPPFPAVNLAVLLAQAAQAGLGPRPPHARKSVRGCVPAYRMVQAGAETSQNIPALPIYDPHLLGVLQVFAPTVCQQVAWCVRTACAAPCDRMPACADRMGLRKLARVAAATAPEEAVESDGQRTPSLSDVPPLKATL
ncbi:unnamed protein product [Closterium sp. NIES-65]|nr:unnamed protein product [Closterium sp. NIES-65]